MPCRPPEPRAAIRPESTKLRLALRSGHASATDAKSSFEERNVHDAHGDEDRPRNPDARAWPFGRPDLCRGAVLSARADEVRIRSIASAINHTDLEIRAGNWPVKKPQPFPYVPGVEVVGEIEEVGHAVQEFRRGDRVITMMQGLGGVRAERPGGYAEYVTVSASAVAPIPSGIDWHEMAAIGLVGVTAFEGLHRIAALSGRRIVVTGAAGGIGPAATAIAHGQDASVIAVVNRADQVD